MQKNSPKPKMMVERVLVLGDGASGLAAVKLAQRQGMEPTLVCKDAQLPEGEFSFAVLSPGVPPWHFWFDELRKRSIPYKSELEFGVTNLKKLGWELFAVTGSKGKSSVVKLVADAIGAVPCGNYGLPVSSVEGDSGRAVVEVSSFMMETTTLPSDTFKAAALINLQKDHLDRHKTAEVYHELKRKLLSFAIKKIDATKGESHFKGSAHLYEGSYFDNSVLKVNAECAVQLMRIAGLDDGAIKAAFKNFNPLPHRMQIVYEREKVLFIDDSKSTSLESLRAALQMCNGSPIRLIAGGLDKADDPKDIIFDLTKQVKKVYLIGCCAEKFFAAWSTSVACEKSVTLENAVKAAKRDAKPGEVVLLSPGAASYDQFKNFGERGDTFVRLVKQQG
ncbi:MAG: hypothetical protein J6S51_01200 [Kiritimatiellae bacterium]|nr:hypothetical protein [Kiritimatiellia bacterium]